MSFKIVVLVAAVFAAQANAQISGMLTPFINGARNGIADITRPFLDLGQSFLRPATDMFSSGSFPQIPQMMSTVQGMIPAGGLGGFAGMIPGGGNIGQMMQPGAFPAQMPLPLDLGGASGFFGGMASGMGSGAIPPSVLSAINSKLNGASGMLPAGIPFPNAIQGQASGQMSAGGNSQMIPGFSGLPGTNGMFPQGTTYPNFQGQGQGSGQMIPGSSVSPSSLANTVSEASKGTHGMLPQGSSYPNYQGQGQASGQASGQMSGSGRPQIGSGSGVSPSALANALSEPTKGISGSLLHRPSTMTTTDYSLDVPYGGSTPLNLQANNVPVPTILKPDLRE